MRTDALTLSFVTSQGHDSRWQRPDEPPARPTSARLVDPEEDLPLSTYGGDFETTAIPPYSTPTYSNPTPGNPAYNSPAPAPPVEPSSGYSLLNDPEPLPYVQPTSNAMHSLAEPVVIAPIDAEERAKAAGKRGTQDLGLLLLRVVIGAIFIAHGLQKAFGWWGGGGIDGFKSALSDAGYQNAGLLTYLGTGGQTIVGILLVLGLFSPVAAAGALAYLVNSLMTIVAAQRQDGYIAVFGPGGIEYLLVMIAAVVAIILVGPGRYGFDAGRGWARRPFVGSAVALLLGLAGGIALWIFLRGNSPF